MSTPRVPHTLWTERAGIIAVASEINRLGLIWREQPSVDVGIDGQIELVDPNGRATGRIVAVQVKSGPSFFKDDGEHWMFHPDEKHRFYWEIFPLPVLLMLHSPADGITYWVDARQALRSTPAEAIKVPKNNQLQSATAADLFYTAGHPTQSLLELPAVIDALCRARTASATFHLTYFDLFVNGLTNIANAIYFGMDLAMEVAEAKLPEDVEWMSFGSEAHDFLFGFLNFLVEQNLATVDVSSCLVDWNTRGLLPKTIAPLTSRGRALVRVIWELQERFQREGRLDVPPGLGVAQEDFVRMEFTASHYYRIPLITAFQQLIREESDRATS
ncbi:MAG TPA: DUF4365 domain-containing protein [Longimicrobium sp.]